MKISPAMLVLMEHGVSLDDIATRLGVTRSAVSLHLVGRSADPTPVVDLVAELAGEDVARQVAARIVTARTARARRAMEVGA